ncbi:MAG: NfeD family protein [Acidobacteriota bacterium]|jgi:membrane protein implicated in regulation of membrane protease activity|nr:NfeD family protein [Acidobacteriota bacterium]
MDVETWVLWMALAAVFIVGEIFTVGFFLCWFGVGAAVAGVLALLGAGEPIQLIAFIVVSFVLFVTGRRFANRVTVEQPPGIGADRFIGMSGVVLEEINLAANTGRIRVGQDPWRAESENGEVIPEGAAVKVLRIDGTRAIVQLMKKETK